MRLVEKIDKDFSFSLYDMDWTKMEPIMNAGVELIPDIAEVGIRSTICGPESFTPDGKPIIGESMEIDGLFYGCGFSGIGMMLSGGAGKQLANLIVNGEPESDLHYCDIS